MGSLPREAIATLDAGVSIVSLLFPLLLLAALLCYGGSDTYRKRLAAIDAEDAQRGGL